METPTQRPLDRFRRGLATYMANIRLFSRNVWMVLFYGIGMGLTFGVVMFTFNFYVLSLGPEFDEGFLGVLQSAACGGLGAVPGAAAES